MKPFTRACARSFATALAFAAATGLAFAEPDDASASVGGDGSSLAISLGTFGTFQLPRLDARTTTLSGREDLSVAFRSTHLNIVGSMSVDSEGRYSAETANVAGSTIGNLYGIMNEGGIISNLGSARLRAGRLRHYDAIDSPYSLFVNSTGRSAMIGEISYEDDRFFYFSRWIELNRGSAAATPAWQSGFPDRGANIKAYGVKFGEMRVGLQDAAVYTGKYFDIEYFLNPLPQYLIQYTKTTLGRPWYTGGNENNIIGLFWDWRREGAFSAGAQFLMDDFNVYFLGIGYHNPWKAALTAGGRIETSAGSFGLYVAGATRFTFEPIGMDEGNEAESAYGYYYYPDTQFDIAKTGAADYVAIPVDENSIGYKYGENNLAVQVDWKGRIDGFDLGAAMEFRLAGSCSPANPWADWHSYPDGGTRFLDDETLEKRVLACISASRRIGNWRLSGTLAAGIAVDALSMRASADVDGVETTLERQLPLYAPVAGLNKPILKICLGGAYEFCVR